MKTVTKSATDTRRRTWPWHVVALALVAAGLLVPHALLVAAGLILAGSVALRPRAER
ncbi:hypothetical protein JNUCC0626_12700 [Lentzea sp. JNUCC 0626]|uniref:hypothetical protein n=1 Tax=Lentzea sp. JNUCC 0626 TaxID=3367513 RepID=UPI003747EAFF